jgi:hypothetical protein
MTKELVVLGAVILVMAACSSNKTESSNTSSAPTETAMAMATATAMVETVTVVIKPLNGSGESGTATLTPLDASRTRVVISLKGESATGSQPAHIHMGTCAKLNPAPKYPLKNVVMGKSNTVVDAPIETITTGGMAINIHESATNITKYVACGDIPK